MRKLLGKKHINFLIKLIVTSVFIFWIFSSDSIDYKNIQIGLMNYKLALAFLVLTFIQLLIGCYRSVILMQFKNESFSNFINVTKITWASSFVHCVSPLSFISDVYRVKHLMAVEEDHIKDNSIYTSIYSKVFSILALVTIAAISCLILKEKPLPIERLSILLYAVVLGSVILVIFRSHFVVIAKKIVNLFYGLSKGAFYTERIDNFRIYNRHLMERKKSLPVVFSLTIFLQLMNSITILLITYALNSQIEISAVKLLCVIPVGIFLMMLPISFSGLGVGHLAFAKLLALFDISNGADIFTIYFAFTLLFNLGGGIPFLFIFKEGLKRDKFA